VAPYSAREHDAFEVTSLLDEVVHSATVRYASNVLLDDCPSSNCSMT
jgi:hypothetical protein